MKTRVLLLTLFTLIGWNAKAQKGFSVEIFAQPGLTMGGEYDVDKSNGIGNPSYDALSKKSTVGVGAGVNMGYFFMQEVGVSVGLGYAHQGQNYKDYTQSFDVLGTSYSATLTRTVSLNYLKIPVQIHFVSAPDKAISFTMAAGFYVGLLLGYDDENKGSGNFGSSSAIAKGSSYDVSSSSTFGTSSSSRTFSGKPYNSTDFGGLIGAGLQFRLSDNVSLPIMLNYQIGFSDIKNKSSVLVGNGNTTTDFYWEDQGGSSSPNKNLAFRNSMLGLMIGLKFTLKN